MIPPLPAVWKPSVYYTHPFIPLDLLVEGQNSVHIAVSKSTYKNLRNEMSYCTITSSNMAQGREPR